MQRIKYPGEYLILGHNERWLLASKCLRCKKAIVAPGRCYKCATGRKPKLIAKHAFIEPTGAGVDNPTAPRGKEE